jgi:hypothetical protein
MHINFGLPLISAEHEPHLPALQYPPARKVRCLIGLHVVHGVEHDHPFGHSSSSPRRLRCRRSRPARF